MNLLDNFQRYIRRNELAAPEDFILLTVSGGVDSMVMLSLFVRSGYRVGVAHCNFQLRGVESEEDEELVRREAEKYGVLPMFYLELISGLRKGELVALQWSDLDIENKTISVSKQAGRNNAGEPDITRPKTENSIRKISIPQDAVDLLVAEHQKHPGSPWMFPSPKTGEMYHPDSVVNIHKKILKDAGLEHLRFHDLRHTFATLALQNGVDVKTVSSMLGHFDAGFTLRTYTHVTRQMQESAAEKMGNFMAQVM